MLGAPHTSFYLSAQLPQTTPSEMSESDIERGAPSPVSAKFYRSTSAQTDAASAPSISPPTLPIPTGSSQLFAAEVPDVHIPQADASIATNSRGSGTVVTRAQKQHRSGISHAYLISLPILGIIAMASIVLLIVWSRQRLQNRNRVQQQPDEGTSACEGDSLPSCLDLGEGGEPSEDSTLPSADLSQRGGLAEQQHTSELWEDLDGAGQWGTTLREEHGAHCEL